ncbi:hypothetical protein KVD21_06950 [Helicobacter pylori]|nr:hypothetical protein KVD21_06950 [Helicobacter pylori]
MRQKSFNELKEVTQAIREQKERSITLTRKTELKPLTRGPKKSVFRARVKEYFNP